MKMTINGKLTPAEQQGLEWLGLRAKWLKVEVWRRSQREFDLSITGTYDGDDGWDYQPSTRLPSAVGERWQINRTKRHTPKVTPHNFSAWFVLAALREFWSLGLHSPAYGDWSFTRDMLNDAQWREFYRIVNLARSKPVFSETFMQALHAVWGMISEDSAQFESNEDAIESCLDADRLCMLGNEDGAAADAELKWHDSMFGSERVSKELAKLVKFV